MSIERKKIIVGISVIVVCFSLGYLVYITQAQHTPATNTPTSNTQPLVEFLKDKTDTITLGALKNNLQSYTNYPYDSFDLVDTTYVKDGPGFRVETKNMYTKLQYVIVAEPSSNGSFNNVYIECANDSEQPSDRLCALDYGDGV